MSPELKNLQDRCSWYQDHVTGSSFPEELIKILENLENKIESLEAKIKDFEVKATSYGE